jgi:hypothetical protein
MSKRPTQNPRLLPAALGAYILATIACGGGGAGFPVGPAANARFLKIVNSGLPTATVGNPYASQLVAQGGAPPLTWEVVLGSLPSGVSLNAQTGLLSGVPKQAGVFAVTFEAVDSTLLQQEQAMASFMLGVSGSPLAIQTAAVPGGVEGKPYSFKLQASGGTLPYFWTVIAGSLPAGLQLDSFTGEISGTPTSMGTFQFTIQVVDSSSPQNSSQVTIASVPPRLGG